MTGWLVINGFIFADNKNSMALKFNESCEYLEEAAKKQNIKLIRKTNIELMNIFSEKTVKKPDFVLFWDKDINLAKMLEKKGFRVFNSAKSIELCDDKALTYIHLCNSDIKMPKTIISPKAYVGYSDFSFLKKVETELGYPLVIKECFGSFGQQVYLANNYEQLLNITNKINLKPMLFQEYISQSHGRDIRINVVGDKVVTAMLRISENGDFRANVTNGAKMLPYVPTATQAQMAVKASKLLGLDFSGVDLMFGKNDEPVFCEVNSNSHFKNIYDCTKINMADYMISHIKEVILC